MKNIRQVSLTMSSSEGPCPQPRPLETSDAHRRIRHPESEPVERRSKGGVSNARLCVCVSQNTYLKKQVPSELFYLKPTSAKLSKTTGREEANVRRIPKTVLLGGGAAPQKQQAWFS